MNRGNPAVKRILADVRELQDHPSTRYHAVPLEDNMFEWHFTIRGPSGTDFENGIYHGRIILPADYPFKPPNIVFLTKNGRFEVGTKICLSISAYHPEHWQPAWGVRTMLEAIISFLPSEGAGAIGALDWTPRERKKLAEESRSYKCPLCGDVCDLLPADGGCESSVTDAVDPEVAGHISQLHLHGLGAETPKKSDKKLNNISNEESMKANIDTDIVNLVETHERGHSMAASRARSPPPSADFPQAPLDLEQPEPRDSAHEGDVEDVVNMTLPPVSVAGTVVQIPPANAMHQEASRNIDYIDYALLAVLIVLGCLIGALLVFKLNDMMDEDRGSKAEEL